MSKLLNPTILSVVWHDNTSPIYSLDFQPNTLGKKSVRLATGGGDNNIRIWKLVYNEDETEVVSVEYLSTLTKHAQAVNCVRFDPTGEFLASASDDGTIMIWALSDKIIREFGSDDDSMKESWYMKTSCRSSSEIYDLAWSPDSRYICSGSLDNVIRIYNSSSGIQVKQVAEHTHFVQGVAWDPRNEYIASQSTDRSVHVYQVSSDAATNDFNISPTTFYKIIRAELPTLKFSRQQSAPASPAIPMQHLSPPSHDLQAGYHSISSMIPPTHTTVHRLTTENLKKMTMTSTPKSSSSPSNAIVSPSPIHHSTASITSNMDPPSATSHKRRLSTSSTGSSASIHRGLTTSPLPAVRMMEPTQIYKSFHLYHNERLQSFFRRLTFSPDGLLLLTASGIYKETQINNNVNSDNDETDNNHQSETIVNTVYINSRSGLNKPPVAHLPGLKRPAIAIKFSQIIYKLDPEYKEVPVFKLNYRMIFAVATQDSVLIYDTQRLKPLGIVSNIHEAVITDVVWSSDGKTIAISGSDNRVSCVVIDSSILGEVETYDIPKWLKENPLRKSVASSNQGSVSSSEANTPLLGAASLSLPKSEPLATTAAPLLTPATTTTKQMSIMDAFLSSANKSEPEASQPLTPALRGTPIGEELTTVVEVIDITDQGDSENYVNPSSSQSQSLSVAPSSSASLTPTTMMSPSVTADTEPGSSITNTTTDSGKMEKKKKRRIAPTLVTTSQNTE